jgi:hypothetical protein
LVHLLTPYSLALNMIIRSALIFFRTNDLHNN